MSLQPEKQTVEEVETSNDSTSSPDDYNNVDNEWGRLIPVTKHKNASVVLLVSDTVIFGRATSCNVVLADPSISGRHCCLRRETICIPTVGSKTTKTKAAADVGASVTVGATAESAGTEGVAREKGEDGAGGGRRRQSTDYLVWLEDFSTNGTYVNNELIGKGNRRLIQTGSVIHFLFKGKGSASNVTYVFQDSFKEQAMQREEGGPCSHYHLLEMLGAGNFAQVRLAVHKETGEKYAIKIIDKKKFSLSIATKRKNVLMDEVKILQTLQHPNIIGIKEMFETESTLYLVLELVTGGELFDKITEKGYFTEEQSRIYFKQMLEAIQYLHQRGIAHRDLKPENILLKDEKCDTIKLSDFGLSRIADQGGFMKTICGTPQYVAPEVITSAKTEGYGLACDLWSAGVILFIMLAGYPPFNESKEKLVFEQIKTADFDFIDEVWSGISESVKNLIRRLLTVNPKERITVEEALQCKWTLGENEDKITVKPPPPQQNDHGNNSISGEEEKEEDKTLRKNNKRKNQKTEQRESKKVKK